MWETKYQLSYQVSLLLSGTIVSLLVTHIISHWPIALLWIIIENILTYQMERKRSLLNQDPMGGGKQ